jgi:hypothetical protein
MSMSANSHLVRLEVKGYVISLETENYQIFLFFEKQRRCDASTRLAMNRKTLQLPTGRAIHPEPLAYDQKVGVRITLRAAQSKTIQIVGCYLQ